MYRIELAGKCFEHDPEQTIMLWFASKGEYSSLHAFITDCWTKLFEEGNYGRPALDEWFAEFQIEGVAAETVAERIREYTSDLKFADISLPAKYTNAVRLKPETWDEVTYAAESAYDYVCFWWYTTA